MERMCTTTIFSVTMLLPINTMTSVELEEPMSTTTSMTI